MEKVMKVVEFPGNPTPDMFIVKIGLLEFFSSIEVDGRIPNDVLTKFIDSGFSLQRLFQIKNNNPTIYPTWEEFNVMCKISPQSDISSNTYCEKLLNELYDCKVFDDSEKVLSKRVDRIISLLTDISSKVGGVSND